MAEHYNILFLCTGNSARSIMAEAILNAQADSRFTAFSAGSHPSGKVRSEALQVLVANNIPATGLRSKSWNEFAQPDAPKIDFVFTVCDNAAREACPLWPGQPVTAHWGAPDPAAVTGSAQEIDRAFREAFLLLRRRIELFLRLPLASLDRLALEQKLRQIGSAS